MHPQLGGVPAFLVGWGLAAVIGGGSLIWLCKRGGLRAPAIAVVFVTSALALFVGSKLLYLLEAWPAWLAQPGEGAATIWSERMRIPGGVLLAIAVGPVLARLLGVRYLPFADTVTPAAGLCLVGIRIGCFFEGCCYGTPSSLPWAVRFPVASDSYRWQVDHGLIALNVAAALPVHPLQLYLALAGLLLFVGPVAYEPRKRYDGEVLMLFALVYFWSTWFLELLRADPHDLTRHLILIVGVVATLAGVGIESRRYVVRHSRAEPAASISASA